MKIPFEWLKDYIKITKTPTEISSSFTALGLMLDKPFKDDVFDLEHRMDRSDWLSVVGCARDLAAFEGLELIFPKLYKGQGKTLPKSDQIEIRVECPDLVRRFNTRVFKNIKVCESPTWIKNRLEAYGIPAINSIVDITNFVMVELGQPMHAQDIAKLTKPEIVIRRAKKDEQITTLLGEAIKLDPDIFVLTQNDKPTVIGGVVGGEATGVDFNTTSIVLDAGNYDQVNIRKTSRKLKIQNETVLRCDKFLHPELTQIAIERATQLILDIVGGEYYENFDYYPEVRPPKQMNIRLSRIKMLGGLDFEMETVKTILSRLEYKIVTETPHMLGVEIPYFRTDVEVEDDIAADVLRINDYDKIPIEIAKSAPPKEITQSIYNFEDKVRDICVNLGLHEHITDPIVSKQDVLTNQVVLENSLNADKTAMRTTIYETLYPVYEYYKKNGITNVGIFEVGKVYFKSGKGIVLEDYEEERQLTVIYQNEELALADNSKKVKELLAGLMQNLGIPVMFEKETRLEANIYSYKNVILGSLKHNAFTLYTDELNNTIKANLRVKQDIFNISSQDITLVMNIEQALGPIVFEIQRFNPEIISVEVVDNYLNEALGKQNKAVTLRVQTQSKNLVLKEKLIAHLTKEFKVQVRTQTE